MGSATTGLRGYLIGFLTDQHESENYLRSTGYCFCCFACSRDCSPLFFPQVNRGGFSRRPSNLSPLRRTFSAFNRIEARACLCSCSLCLDSRLPNKTKTLIELFESLHPCVQCAGILVSISVNRDYNQLVRQERRVINPSHVNLSLLVFAAAHYDARVG